MQEPPLRTTTLQDGTTVHCIRASEALVLDSHVHGYLAHGVTLPDDAVVLDVGANIGLFALRVVQRHPEARVLACEPVPAIFEVLDANAEISRERDGSRKLTHVSEITKMEGDVITMQDLFVFWQSSKLS